MSSQTMRTARLCFLESRPRVAGIFQLRFLSAAVLTHTAAPAAAALLRLAAHATGWALCVLFVYVFNGVSDIVEDRANGSRRPIARGKLNPEVALRWAIAAGALGVSVCFSADLLTGMMALLYVLVGYAYSGAPYYLKRTPAAAATAIIILGLTTYVAGSDGLGAHRVTAACVLIAITMSLWMGLVGAVTKDFGDVAGDVLAGRRNCVAQSGLHVAQVRVCVSAAVLCTAFLVGAVVWASDELPAALALIAGSALLAHACRVTFLRLRTDSSRATAKVPYRVFMWTQYAVHVAVLAVVLAS